MSQYGSETDLVCLINPVNMTDEEQKAKKDFWRKVESITWKTQPHGVIHYEYESLADKIEEFESGVRLK